MQNKNSDMKQPWSWNEDENVPRYAVRGEQSNTFGENKSERERYIDKERERERERESERARKRERVGEREEKERER